MKKIKDTCHQAHAYCDGVKDGAMFALKLIEDHAANLTAVKDALNRCIDRQINSMADMEETADTKKDSCI